VSKLDALQHPSSRGGRPTRAEALRRRQHLVEVASEMFMKFGFDRTSIDAVAETAGVSKRTVYAQYRDKDDLFNAVLRSLIERWLIPINQFELSTSELEPMLIEVGRSLLAAALAPKAVSLHRIIISESERRPQFGRLANAEGREPAIRAIATALERHSDRLRVMNLERAAEHFLGIVVDNNLWRAAMGLDLITNNADDIVRTAVDLFLRGAQRSDATPKH
jgi:TetR/AcrR family transcriptional repressor of mexJK operon